MEKAMSGMRSRVRQRATRDALRTVPQETKSLAQEIAKRNKTGEDRIIPSSKNKAT
jgi:hypothetical protein